jgi:chromosomal replication initiation ATPase DnaA
MYLDEGLSRQEIADHYATNLGRVRTALRAMDCKLPPDEVRRRSHERLLKYNKGRQRNFAQDNSKPAPPYTITDLVNAAHWITRASVDDIKGRDRVRFLARIRQAVWFLAQGHYSYLRISRAFCRDHTTVIHGCRVAYDLIETCSGFRDLVDAIRTEALRAKEKDRVAISQILTRIAA